MKKTFNILLTLLTITAFNSCQKNSDVVEPDAVMKNAAEIPELEINLPENICADEEFEVLLSASNNIPGKMEIAISEDDGISWKNIAETSDNKASGNFYLRLNAGSYKIKGIYSGLNQDRALVIKSNEIDIDVQDCPECESIVIEPGLEGNDFLVNAGETKTFTAEYRIFACDQDYYDLVLRGKINSGAEFKFSSPRSVINNGEISWNIGNVKAGFSYTYKITFEYKIPSAGFGTLIPLTGGWIIEGKTSDGSSVLAGDNNEIFVQVK